MIVARKNEEGREYVLLQNRTVQFITRRAIPVECLVRLEKNSTKEGPVTDTISDSDSVEYWSIKPEECPASLFKELASFDNGKLIKELKEHEDKLEGDKPCISEELNRFYPVAIKEPENVEWIKKQSYFADYDKVWFLPPLELLMMSFTTLVRADRRAEESKEKEAEELTNLVLELSVLAVVKKDNIEFEFPDVK